MEVAFMEVSKSGEVAYGGGLARKLRPRHVATVAANETRMLFSGLIIPRLAIGKKQFLLWGESRNYFLHRYNTTWRNERAVEMSAVSAFLNENPNGSLLEFGNVLDHYQLRKPDVIVDLYEKGERITNCDIVDFSTNRRFDLIVSISTLEHVGWDEWPQSSTKTKQAFDVLTALLAPGGKMFITTPTGHNPYLDEIIRAGVPHVIRQSFLVRTGFEWHEQSEFVALPYGSRGPGAASMWVAEFRCER